MGKRVYISQSKKAILRFFLNIAFFIFDRSCCHVYGASSLYYAAFHAMSALLIHDGYSMKKHSGVISKFRELYIKTGVFETEMSEQIAALFKLRTECDYDTFYVVAKSDVEEQLANAESIISTIEGRLGI